MKTPPAHVLARLDDIIVGQEEAKDGGGTPPRHVLLQNCDDDDDDAVNAAIRRAGLEGKQRTNPVVDGQLVPKPPGPHNKKRRREEPAVPPAAPPRKRVSAPPADHLLGYLDLAPLLRGDACLDAIAQP